jgi:hypothetical protein
MIEEAPTVEEIRERYLAAREPEMHEPTPGFVAPTLEELEAARSEDLLLPDEGMVGVTALRGAGGWIRLKAGPNHDPGSGRYVEAHPTHYRFSPGVRRLVEKYINMSRFRGKVWANTYGGHPPGIPGREDVSVDFWDWAGRGRTIRNDLQRLLESVILKDQDRPNILWMISNGRMWTPERKWERWQKREDGSDPSHYRHIHVTFDRSA